MTAESAPRSRIPILIAAALGILLIVILWPAAPKRAAPDAEPTDLKVVCTFLPMYVFTLNVVGDVPGVKVDLLVPADTGCPHSYALRPNDLKLVAEADVVVANGLGIEEFLHKLIEQNREGRLVLLSHGCDVLPRHGEHHHEHASHEGEDDEEAEAELHAQRGNPHVWVSPLEAITQVRNLARELGEVDPAHARTYEANAEAYAGRLQALYERMKKATESLKNRRIVTFHDAFDYLARDLDLEVVATLTVDPGSALSANQMLDVIKAIKETRPAAIFCEPAYSDRAARTVGQDTDVPVFALNPFNTIDGQATAGSYEAVADANLEVLQEALGSAP